MSTIETFYNTNIDVYRQTTASPTATDSIGIVSTFMGVIRPIAETSKLFFESNIGKEYDLVCDSTSDVLVGDTIIGLNELTNVTTTYTAIGVSTYQDLLDNSDSYINVRITTNG